MTFEAGSRSTKGAQLDALGSKITVLVPSEDVGGAYSIVEEIDEPGAGSPPHANTRETLAITVVDGDLEVVLPGRSVKLGPGESMSPPRGVRHSTRNVGSVPSRTLFTFVPGGFERFFVEVAALGEGGAQDMDRVAEIAAAYGMQIAPPEEGWAMSLIENKVVAMRTFEEVWNQRNVDAIDDMFATDFLDY